MLTLAKVYGGNLAPLDQVKAALAAEVDVSKVADFAKRVEAEKSIDSHNAERQNYWAELAIWSTRRLGEMLLMAKNEGMPACTPAQPCFCSTNMRGKMASM